MLHRYTMKDIFDYNKLYLIYFIFKGVHSFIAIQNQIKQLINSNINSNII